MDIQLMQDKLKGLETKGKNLRAKEALFLKAQGLDEQIEKNRVEITPLEDDVSAMKDELAELKGQKAEAVASTAAALTKKMNEVLPEGVAVFTINGKVFFGWEIDGQIKPYNGLSGGERIVFDGALSHALQADVLIYEAAETDEDRLAGLLEQLSNIDGPQVIVNTCHSSSGAIPEGFTVTEL